MIHIEKEVKFSKELLNQYLDLFKGMAENPVHSDSNFVGSVLNLDAKRVIPLSLIIATVDNLICANLCRRGMTGVVGREIGEIKVTTPVQEGDVVLFSLKELRRRGEFIVFSLDAERKDKTSLFSTEFKIVLA